MWWERDEAMPMKGISAKLLQILCQLEFEPNKNPQTIIVKI